MPQQSNRDRRPDQPAPAEAPAPQRRPFLAELRQRKVVQVTVSYLVVAWLLVQVASIALPAFNAPAWGMRFAIFLLALGLPLALVLAWAFDVGGHGIRRIPGKAGNLRIGVAAAMLAALALLWYVYGQPVLHDRIVVEERSIAVLPFANMSGDRANEYFSDGLAETTLDMLAQVADLKVIARTSSFAFKGRHGDVREIGRVLGVAHLLEGSVQQAGDTLRITAQLVRASDGSHLWSRRYDRRRSDVFRIQDEIATEVVAALQAALPATERRQMREQRTDNVAAYDEYLKGLALLPEENVADLRRALRHFDAAIALDPTYARAYVSAAATLRTLDLLSQLTPAQAQRRTRYVDRALELAPDLGEALTERAALMIAQDRLQEADKVYARAIELAPGHAVTYELYGRLLFFTNRMQRGAAMYRRAVALDPLSPALRREYAAMLGEIGRLREAEREVDALLRQHPGYASGYGLKAQLRSLQGDLAGALRTLRDSLARDPENIDNHATACYLLASFVAYDEMRQCVLRFEARFPGTGLVADLAAWVAQVEGRLDEVIEAPGLPGPSDGFARAMLLNEAGRAREAAELLRHEAPALLASPPDVAHAPLQTLIQAGDILRATDDDAARPLLEEALRRVQALPPGPTQNTRQWFDAIVLGLLGRHEEACTAIRASGEAGLFTDWHALELPRGLAPLRAQPCYAQAMQPIRQRATAAADSARAKGLLAPYAGTGESNPPRNP